MNITKKVKIKPEKPIQSKPSFLIISTNYQVETLYHILTKNPSLVNNKDQKGETFLSYAIKRKNIENAELILTSPLLDYKYQDKNGNSYLHLAVINRLENIAKILIEKGININLQNNEGNTALHFAYSTGDMNLIRLIIESKADFTIKNNNGLIGEEIKEGTFPEILDVSNNNLNKNIINDVNISDNKDNKNNSKELDLNPDIEIKDYSNPNNEIIMNEKGQINKSIKMDWDNTDANGNSKLTDNNNSNMINTSNNINQSLSQQNSKIKFSLVNFSYSEEDNNEETLKNKQKISEIKNCVQSSDIFDLASSSTYQEKLANMNNSHTVGEPKIIQKKESTDSNTNEDIVNINKINNNQNKPLGLIDNNSINVNDIIQNGIQLSQISFQTSYENGRKNMISNVSNSNDENGLPFKSEDNKKDKIFNENININTNRGNGKINIIDFCKSLTKEEINQNKYQYIKKDSEGSSNKNDYNNINKSNINQSKIEQNENFAFSPFSSLKKPLNNKLNGSEININNNHNSNNFNNININNEIKNQKNQNIKEYKTLAISSPKINKYDTIKENNIEIKSQKSQTIEEINKKNKIIHNRNRNKLIQNFSETNLNNISTKNSTKINLDCPLNSTQEISNSCLKIQDSLNKFLSEIRLEKYYSLMKSNGFDDVQLLLNQTKTGIAITDNQLKSAGINIPGDRAKILIRLQEKAGNFNFQVPKEVYYICQNIEDYSEDKNINRLKSWLEELKVDNYLDNFVKNGYHSLELMLLQIESKNQITEDILKDEIGIDKIGHRSRIINGLKEEAKVAYNKWKNSVLIIGDLTRKICDCNIF